MWASLLDIYGKLHLLSRRHTLASPHLVLHCTSNALAWKPHLEFVQSTASLNITTNCSDTLPFGAGLGLLLA